MQLYTCPGCSCQYTTPVPAEEICTDLKCKYCGAAVQGVEQRTRICAACGRCGICSSEHTVMVRGPVMITKAIIR